MTHIVPTVFTKITQKKQQAKGFGQISGTPMADSFNR